uniref:Uncharacterized protein n=1 Tax=Panagrellus redivivus TaxID=6233 RepID=A0A7E4UVK4_PANRE
MPKASREVLLPYRNPKKTSTQESLLRTQRTNSVLCSSNEGCEVTEQLREIKPKLLPTTDGIPGIILQRCSQELAVPLAVLFLSLPNL